MSVWPVALRLSMPRILIGTDETDGYDAGITPGNKEARHGPGHIECDTEVRWSRLPGQVCGKIKLKPMSSCREFGHQIMGGMPPMI